MTKETFFQWYREVFIPQVREYQAENLECPQKAYLILDNAPSHPSAEELNSVDTNFEGIYLPPNVTSIIQPMDQGIIEKSKRLYKKSCLRELLLERDDEGITQFMKSQNLKDCCNRIANAWEQVTPQNIRNAWKKLLVTGTFEGQECKNELEVRQTMDLVHRVPRYAAVSFDYVRRWLDEDCDETGWEVLNAEQILDRIQVHSNHYGQQTSDTESSEDEESTRAGTGLSDSAHTDEEIPILHEALEGLRTFQKYFETRWECEGKDPQIFQGYRDRVLELLWNSSMKTNFLNEKLCRIPYMIYDLLLSKALRILSDNYS